MIFILYGKSFTKIKILKKQFELLMLAMYSISYLINAILYTIFTAHFTQKVWILSIFLKHND